MKNICFILCILLSAPVLSMAQFRDSAFSLGIDLDVYFGSDFGYPEDNRRPDFLYSYTRTDEPNINLGLIRLGYQQKKVRANLGLMAGTYPNENLAKEPGILRQIFELNAGVKLSPKNNLWLDAGVFASHLGFESAIGSDCYNLTRSMMAESAPYYESGLKITYRSPDEKWLLSGLVLNGWQRIRWDKGYSMPSFGHQISYTFAGGATLNGSSFIGTDDPDSTRRMRYFHDLYWQTSLSQKWSLIAGVDVGIQQKEKGSRHYDYWLVPICMVRYHPVERWAFSARIEYFQDPGEVIIAPESVDGFQNTGFSLNADWWLHKRLCWRLEGRYFTSPDLLFQQNGNPVSSNLAIYTSVSVRFF